MFRFSLAAFSYLALIEINVLEARNDFRSFTEGNETALVQ